MESSHWRCGSCGARFASGDATPRCPKCLKQSLVAPDEPAPPPVFVDAPHPPPAPAVDRGPPSRLLLVLVALVVVAALVTTAFVVTGL